LYLARHEPFLGSSAICPDLHLDPLTCSDGFRLIFINTLHGQVYSQSPKFSIYPSIPSNFTAPGKSHCDDKQHELMIPRLANCNDDGDAHAAAGPDPAVGHHPQWYRPRCDQGGDCNPGRGWRCRLSVVQSTRLYHMWARESLCRDRRRL
jgi:hypothetical protein